MSNPFDLPPTDLEALTFCGPNEGDFISWIGALPLANIGETSRQIFHALGELSHLKTTPERRFALLESSRTAVHYVGRALEKHFIKQTVILEEKQLRIANLVQTMQGSLSTGYQAVIAGILQNGPALRDESKRLIATAIHRAICELGLTALRSCQMYAGAPDGVWLKVHKLYALAEQHGVLGEQILEPENRYCTRSSVLDAYKHLLLLGSCKPNQLRQRDLAAVYTAIEHWTGLVSIHKTVVKDDLFSVNLQEDRVVSYHKLSTSESENQHWRGLDTHELVDAMQKCAESMEDIAKTELKNPPIEVPEDLDLRILSHLIHAWGSFFERSDSRQPCENQVRMCIGLTAVQYFVSGMIDFNTQMSGGTTLSTASDNVFLDEARKEKLVRGDAWSNAFDAGGSGFKDLDVARLESILGIGNRDVPQMVKRKRKPGEELDWSKLADKMPTQAIFSLNQIDSSQGGCCISWGAQPSDRVQDGQIVAMQDHEDQPWSIGVVRWIQHRDNELRTGIEVLAQTAYPCGASVIHRDRAAADYLRALELPGIGAIGHKASLLLPNVPFKEGNKIWINRFGKKEKALLERSLFTTGTFARFEYRSLEIPIDTEVGNSFDQADKPGKGAAKPGDKDFDNLWETL